LSLNELVLPIYSYISKQNTVHFLTELDNYFSLKCISDSITLSITTKAITNNRHVTGYEQFRQAIRELLWSPQVHSQVCCSIYQDQYDKGIDKSMSAHFLRHAVLIMNLTPKLSELDMIDAIAGHYPIYVHRPLLSASVRTVQEASGSRINSRIWNLVTAIGGCQNLVSHTTKILLIYLATTFTRADMTRAEMLITLEI
jgi:hypothetical protein